MCRVRLCSRTTMCVRSVVVAASICLAGSANVHAQSHLVPESSIWDAPGYKWRYAEKLRATLLKDAPHYYLARMICLPAFDKEWVVSVVAEDEHQPFLQDKGTYVVEYAVVEKQLWEEKEFRRVKVTRSRVRLDTPTVVAVSEAWALLLQDTRYPDDGGDRGTDQDSYHFARAIPNNRIKFGGNDGFEQGYITSPNEDSLPHQLVSIGEELRKYATVAPEKQKDVGRRIQALAKELKARHEKQRKTPSVSEPKKRG